MCDTVYIPATGQEFHTVRELMDLVGETTVTKHRAEEYDDLDLDSCLCRLDVEPLLQAAGYDVTREDGTWGNYHAHKQPQ